MRNLLRGGVFSVLDYIVGSDNNPQIVSGSKTGPVFLRIRIQPLWWHKKENIELNLVHISESSTSETYVRKAETKDKQTT